MPKMRHNPDLDASDITEKAVPGGGAYVATRFLSYATYQIAQKKAPTMAKHIAVGASVAAAGLAWAFGHRIKQLEKYYEPILIGSSVAAVQGILQAYVPQYAYFLDAPVAPVAAVTGAPMVTQPVAASDYDSLLDDFEEMPLGLPSGSIGPAPVPPAQSATLDNVNQFDPIGDWSDAQ